MSDWKKNLYLLFVVSTVVIVCGFRAVYAQPQVISDVKVLDKTYQPLDYMISGHVYKENSGSMPVDGVQIQANFTQNSQNFYANTDSSGSYTINVNTEGDYQFKLTRSGYNDKTESFYINSNMTRDFTISQSSSGGTGDGFNLSDQLPEWVMTVAIAAGVLCISGIIAIIIISIAAIAIFVRLGKIRKGLDKMSEGLDKVERQIAVQQTHPVQPPVRTSCSKCGKTLEPEFVTCPFCGTPK